VGWLHGLRDCVDEINAHGIEVDLVRDPVAEGAESPPAS